MPVLARETQKGIWKGVWASLGACKIAHFLSDHYLKAEKEHSMRII